jgi:serine phosphatase RsbU (regulator of sigma subunit)
VLSRARLQPSAPPVTENWSLFGVEICSRILAAEGALIGGDWCEAFPLGDDLIALSIGDVCGHGDEKYPARVAVRQAIRAAADAGFDAVETLMHANDFLRDYDPDEYATAVFGILDVARRTFAFANAGHPPPLLCTNAGPRYVEYDETSLPLGIADEIDLTLRIVRVPESSLVVLYTDGFTEREKQAAQGAIDLLDAARLAYRFPALSSASVIEHHLGLPNGNTDDAAMLTVWSSLAARHNEL